MFGTKKLKEKVELLETQVDQLRKTLNYQIFSQAKYKKGQWVDFNHFVWDRFVEHRGVIQSLAVRDDAIQYSILTVQGVTLEVMEHHILKSVDIPGIKK